MAQLMNCAEKVDRLVVAVGSAEHKNEKRNPFSAAERVKMVKAYIKEMGLEAKRIRVVAVKDGKTFADSVANLFRTCGKIDVVFMDRRWPRSVVERKNAKVWPHPIKGRAFGMSSTRIRDAIAKGKRWESFTGRSVAALIRKFDGIRRIKALYAKGTHK